MGFTLVEVLLASAITALPCAALVHVLSDVLDLSSVAREGSDPGREAQLAVALLRNDIGAARRITQLSEGTLELLTAAGVTIRYTWDVVAPDTLWRTSGAGDPAPVAAGMDSVSFALETLSRPFTTEADQAVAYQKTAADFVPGEWDAWIASTPCVYDARGERTVRSQQWCAEEFYTAEAFTAFSTAAVRVRAKDRSLPDVDLLVRIYLASATAPRYPSTLIAEGIIPRTSLSAEYEWKEASLTTVSATPIPAGGHFWLVVRPRYISVDYYAGHLEYEAVSGCLGGGWPGTDIHYRESDDAGVKWSLRTPAKEAFFRVTGLQTTLRLAEIAQTLADTLGVSYAFRIQAGEEPERSAGFIALPDL